MSCVVRVRRPGGEPITINLIELEEALQGVMPGDYYLALGSGRVIFKGSDEIDEIDEIDDGNEEEFIPEDEETVPIDTIESRVQFRWMEEFVDTVHSIAAQNALRDALRHKRPFRNFKDALLEFPVLREKWFQLEALKVRAEALDLLESIDFEILEIVDSRPVERITEEIDPAENVPLTSEEHECILRGAWQIAAKGGRSQLSLLLKGSKNKSVLKHGLDQSPVYGKLSYLTIEEIENRIDQLIRKGELRTEFFGDLPLILLTDEAWMSIREWAHAYECHLAASASARGLIEILNDWRNRRREEQHQLLEAMVSTEREAASRVLQAWHEMAGKEMRAKIEAALSTLG
ncbi:MAG TPA: UPF0158 family protein [Terriglobia bacterium]|nr:UPF0158 family protein [Terriglobia bacterium]